MKRAAPSITSPCVSNCCLDNNDMCVGCFRLMEEILIWSDSDEVQKQNILDVCAQRKAQHKDIFTP